MSRFQPAPADTAGTPPVSASPNICCEQKRLSSPSTESPAITEPHPVKYLKTLLGNTEIGQRILKRQRAPSFAKPDQDALDAYDMSVVKAVRERDLVKLQAQIAEGKSMDACNRFGESLIHMACRLGDEAVVKLLIFDGGIRLDARDDFGRTPLHDAAWTSNPNFKVMDLLLKACSIDLLLAEDVRGHSPFHYARKEHWDVWVDFLKERRELILSKLSSHFSVVG